MTDKEKIKAAVSKLRRKDPRVIAIRNMIALAKAKGTPGDTGKNGIDGLRGADGINGMNGIDGLRGTDGLHGAKGLDGLKGEVGAVGPQGDKGEAGMIWRGTYRNDIEYDIGDVVGVSGSAYVCVAATNQAPPVGFGWELLVSRGAQGIRGIKGEDGTGGGGAAAAGTLTGATLAANVVTSSLTQVGTLEFLTVTNTITGSITGNAASATVATSASSALTATTATTATSATTAATVTTAAQPTITSVGTLTAINTSGVITGTNTTASTSSTTGALIIAGGVGIAKDSFINGHRIGVGLLASQTNLAVGTNALNSTIALGVDNVAVGYLAGQNVTSGANNVMLGSNAGFSNTSGASYNVFLGSNAGYFITSGNETTCVGGDAGRRQADGSTNMTASSNSVYIGYNAKGFNNSDSNTIVIGSNAIGLGANKTTIGTSSTTESKLFGQLTLDATACISASTATALALKTVVPAGTGVTPTVQIICPSAAYTLTNGTGAQAVFNTGMRTITLQASTTYMFEGQYLITTGTTTHITSMSFVLTSATMTNCNWATVSGSPTALNAGSSGAFTAIFNSVAGGAINTTTTAANKVITFKGIMRVNAAGTLVPNIAFSAAPGVTCSTLIGSYIKFYPIGSNTIDSVGTAIS